MPKSRATASEKILVVRLHDLIVSAKHALSRLGFVMGRIHMDVPTSDWWINDDPHANISICMAGIPDP